MDKGLPRKVEKSGDAWGVKVLGRGGEDEFEVFYRIFAVQREGTDMYDVRGFSPANVIVRGVRDIALEVPQHRVDKVMSVYAEKMRYWPEQAPFKSVSSS